MKGKHNDNEKSGAFGLLTYPKIIFTLSLSASLGFSRLPFPLLFASDGLVSFWPMRRRNPHLHPTGQLRLFLLNFLITSRFVSARSCFFFFRPFLRRSICNIVPSLSNSRDGSRRRYKRPRRVVNHSLVFW
jgi:hypothetical protein